MRKMVLTGFLLILAGAMYYFQKSLDEFIGQASKLTEGAKLPAGAVKVSGNSSVREKQFAGAARIPGLASENGLENPVEKPGDEQVGLTEEEWDTVRMIQARFASGDYQTCLDMIRTSLDENGHTEDFIEWLDLQLGSVLLSTGWVHLKTGHCEKAIDDFKGAEARGSKFNEVYSGLAYCYHHLRMPGPAREAMEKYLKTDPDNFKLQILYSDILESNFEFEKAVGALEKAVGLGQDEQQLQIVKQKLASMKKKSRINESQTVRESSHFTLSYPGGTAPDVVARILDILEQGHALLIDRYQFRELRSPVQVNLYPSQSFQDVMAHGPGWMSGVYNGKISVPLAEEVSEEAFWRRLTSVLHHELVHAVFHEMSGRRSLPTWIEEGVAQRFTCSGQGCNVVNQQMGTGAFYGQKDFEAPFTKFSEAKARSLYQQSLYLILYLEAVYPDAIRLISERVQPQGSLASNELLGSFEFGFSGLLERAREKWTERIPLTMNAE